MTIYPGRASPTRRSSNRQLCNEVRSRDSSRMLEPEYAATNHHHVSSTSPSIVHPSQLSFSLDPPPSGEPLDSLSSNHQPFDRDKLHHSDWDTRSNKRKSSDCEDFSDDSLEGLSLPPPPPSIIVPPPPSLSAPVTPNKRASVAWEIRLDVRETTSPRKQQHHTPQLEPEVMAFGKFMYNLMCNYVLIHRAPTALLQRRPAHPNPTPASRHPTKVRPAPQSNGPNHQRCLCAAPKTKLARCTRIRKSFCSTSRTKSKTMAPMSYGKDAANVICCPI